MAKEQTTTIIDGKPRRLISERKAWDIINKYANAASIDYDKNLYFQTIYARHKVDKALVSSIKKGEREIFLDTITITMRTNLPEGILDKIRYNLEDVRKEYRDFLKWHHNGLDVENYVNDLTWTIPIVTTKLTESCKQTVISLFRNR